MKTFSFLIILIATLFSCGKIGPRPLSFVLQNCWSTVGAAGIPDETARPQIIFGQSPDPDVIAPEDGAPVPNTTVLDGTITLDNRSPAGLYQIRFPLNQQFIFNLSEGQDDFPYPVFLQAKYKVRDAEKEAVRIQLKRLQISDLADTEVSEVILEIDSDQFGTKDAFQVQSVFKEATYIDFSKYAYYVDLQMFNKGSRDMTTVATRQSISPAVAFIQICAGGGSTEN